MERDLSALRESVVPKLAYLHSKRPEHYEARIVYAGVDTFLALIDDYQVNRDKAIELLNKLQNPDLAITMDVDNS